MPTLTELAARLQELATRRGLTVATAESCTGGNVAHQITSISGSSAYFLGGVVSYANEVKRDVLGVPEEVLENPGAVSEPCARAMAEGVRCLMGSDLAISTTGIAGPLGGTARKPVGLVYLALATADRTTVEEHLFPGERVAVIDAATRRALELVTDAATLAPQDRVRASRTTPGST
jgi:PncC family amidohydrolase